jgi:predicted transcriptional regulator
MALGSTQPLAEMSTRNLPGGKGRPVRKAYKLTAICEPIV